MATSPQTASPDLSPSALRTRFKSQCAATGNVHQNWQIRVHRSLSWLTRGVEFPEDELEAKFLFLWIAFNCLYSRWDPKTNAPDVDGHARSEFLDRVCRLNTPFIAEGLHKHRPLVKRILADQYLSPVFWRNPEQPQAVGRATQDRHHLDQHLKNHKYCIVLKQVLDRLFILRGQIVHGASTQGSRLNRTALRNAVLTLQQLVPILLHVAIEHGCGDDWPDLCYPPEP